MKRRVVIAVALAVVPACTIFVDLDRFDRGGTTASDARPGTGDASIDVAIDVRVDVDFDVRIDVPRPPKEDGASPFDAAAGCNCNGLDTCCKAMSDPFDRQACESELSFSKPDDEDCCYVLLFFRDAKKCP